MLVGADSYVRYLNKLTLPRAETKKTLSTRVWKGKCVQFKLALWNRILKSLIKVGYPLSDFPILSDFLTGRKPWSF